MSQRITDMLGIDLPLLAFSHCRDVVVAVTNAGGFGVLGSDVDFSGDLARYIPDAQFDFVNSVLAAHGIAPLLPTDLDQAMRVDEQHGRDLLEVAMAHPISLIASALGVPPSYMIEAGKARGVPVAALVGAKEHAMRQVAAGVDIIVAQGSEAGGHTGEVGTMVLVPEVVAAVSGASDIPVLAAGGIVTGSQMAAAIALGAAGVWTGSVWLTTEEAETHPVTRDKLVAASSRDTVRSKSRTGKFSRQLVSDWTLAWGDPQSPAALPMPLQSVLSEPAMARVEQQAALGNAAARSLASYFVGQGVGLMNRVRPARDVVLEMAEDFASAMERVASFMD